MIGHEIGYPTDPKKSNTLSFTRAKNINEEYDTVKTSKVKTSQESYSHVTKYTETNKMENNDENKPKQTNEVATLIICFRKNVVHLKKWI